jgi:DivIVA domain-containing protein
MELTPQDVISEPFTTVKRGFDPDEVRSFLSRVAGALESSNERAIAMEARARAAMTKLQEGPAAPDAGAPSGDEGAIGRVLLKAQAAADELVAEARDEAERIRSAAVAERDEAEASAQRARDDAVQLATAEARRAGEAERLRVSEEVEALLARRDFLLADVDHLEGFVAEERSRIGAVAERLIALVGDSTTGLGEAHRPVVSAAGSDPIMVDDPAVTSTIPEDPTGEVETGGGEATDEHPAPSPQQLSPQQSSPQQSSPQQLSAEPLRLRTDI